MKKRVSILIFYILFLISLLVLYYIFYNTYHIGIPCLFYKITGYKCPGCGITRALFSLMEGDIKRAYSFNKMLILIIPFGIIYAIDKGYLYIVNKKSSYMNDKVINIISTILLIISIIYGICRNI